MVDAALHPTMQGRVLLEMFRSLRREIPRWNDADFGFSFASHPALLRNRGFQGRHDLGRPLETYVRPLDLMRFVRGERSPARVAGDSRTRGQIEMERRGSSRKPAVARLAAWQARLVRDRMRRRPLVIPSQSAFEVRSLDRFDERIDTFCIEAATAFDLIQARDQGYLKDRKSVV